jgi:hypothetical protein
MIVETVAQLQGDVILYHWACKPRQFQFDHNHVRTLGIYESVCALVSDANLLLTGYPKFVGGHPETDGRNAQYDSKYRNDYSGQRHNDFVIVFNRVKETRRSVSDGLTDRQKKGLETLAAALLTLGGLQGFAWWFWRRFTPPDDRRSERKGKSKSKQ